MASNIITLGKYEIDWNALLGKGGQGAVYKCRLLNSNNWDLCIKQSTFWKEKNISLYVQNLKSQNLVKIIDVIEVSSKLNIIMELCDYNLEYEFKSLLNARTWYKEDEILDCIEQILNGLHVLNSNNVMHRDLKPENILVQMKENKKKYKIGDYGISKQSDDIESANRNQSNVGTQIFKSPQISCYRPYSAKCDIYSGGILFHLLINRMQHPNQKKYNQQVLVDDINFKKQIKENKFECKFPEYKIWGDLFEQLLCSMIVYAEEERISLKEIIEQIIKYHCKLIFQVIINKNTIYDWILQKASQQGLLSIVDCKIIEYNILLFQLEQLKIGIALFNGIINDIPKSLIFLKNFNFIFILETLKSLKEDPSFKQQSQNIETNYFLIKQRIQQIDDKIQKKIIGNENEFILPGHFKSLKQLQVQKNIKKQISEFSLLKSLFENNKAMELQEFVGQIIKLEEKFCISNYQYLNPEDINLEDSIFTK